MPQETARIDLFLGSRGLTGVLRVLPKPGAVDAPGPGGLERLRNEPADRDRKEAALRLEWQL